MRTFWCQYNSRNRFFVLGAYLILVAVGLIVPLIWLVTGEEQINSVILNVATELTGTLATLFLIDRLIARRERVKNDQLFGVLQLRLATTSEQRQAIIDWMKRANLLREAQLNWLDNLQGLDFSGANLEGADLGGSNLQEANLFGANLRRVILGSTHLEGASLEKVVLTDADMHSAHLTHLT